ncbi:MAG: DUF1905 domain-containing protein [Actinomycetota bacterium]
MARIYSVTGELEIFEDAQSPWRYLKVPEHFADITAHLKVRGRVSITATLGGTTWETSLLSGGDGSHFIAVNAGVRKAEDVGLGDWVSVSFTLREP